MDPLADFLGGPRASSAFLLKVHFEAPWSMRIEDDAPLTVFAITGGSVVLIGEGAVDPVPLVPGDVVVARDTEHYVIADDPATEPTIVVGPGGHCQTLDGASLVERLHLGVRTWGNSPDGSDTMLVGTYSNDGAVSRWLLDALPPQLVVREHEWDAAAVGLLAREITRDEPGQQVVLDRLLDLILVGALRAAATNGSLELPAWYRAHADPVVGPVVQVMQRDPATPWTVAELASTAGVSRAQLARRFHELVGEPPMSFLTRWRMSVAADLLRDPTTTVTQVAASVGYGSPFTFSTAFKRHHGTSPRAYRDQLATAADTQAVAR